MPPSPIRVSRDAARRFLVTRHLLAPPRSLPAEPASVMAVFEQLGSIQFDPLEVAGRNHDLVLLSRVAGYRRAWTDALLYDERRLFEAYNKGLSLLPSHELPWYRVTWDRNRAEHETGVFARHPELVEELLTRIRAEGPLSTLDFGAREAIDWWWRPTSGPRAVLEALAQSGVLGLARRQGNRRYYDLVERLFPADLLAIRPDERDQRRHRLLSRYRAHGMLGRSGSAELWMGTAPAARKDSWTGPLRGELLSGLLEEGELVPVEVEGVRGERYVLGAEIDALDAAERPLESSGVAFLAPLDPFVWDREFLRSLFDFDYIWEVYVPEAKRRWGYYVLPILFGDRLVGRIEPRIDRRGDALRIVNLWWEPGFDAAPAGFLDAFGEALEAHRAFAEVRGITFERPRSHGAIPAAMRERLPAARARPRPVAAPRSAAVGR
jgi:uncharacterized protein YcaQ